MAILTKETVSHISVKLHNLLTHNAAETYITNHNHRRQKLRDFYIARFAKDGISVTFVELNQHHVLCCTLSPFGITFNGDPSDDAQQRLVDTLKTIKRDLTTQHIITFQAHQPQHISAIIQDELFQCDTTLDLGDLKSIANEDLKDVISGLQAGYITNNHTFTSQIAKDIHLQNDTLGHLLKEGVITLQNAKTLRLNKSDQFEIRIIELIDTCIAELEIISEQDAHLDIPQTPYPSVSFDTVLAQASQYLELINKGEVGLASSFKDICAHLLAMAQENPAHKPELQRFFNGIPTSINQLLSGDVDSSKKEGPTEKKAPIPTSFTDTSEIKVRSYPKIDIAYQWPRISRKLFGLRSPQLKSLDSAVETYLAKDAYSARDEINALDDLKSDTLTYIAKKPNEVSAAVKKLLDSIKTRISQLTKLL